MFRVLWSIVKNPKVIKTTAKCLLMTLFLLQMVCSCDLVFGTIDPNNYSVNMSLHNQNQGINISDPGTTARYASVMRTLSVSTNSPSGYRIYINVPSDEPTAGVLTLAGGTGISPSISPLNTTPATASTLSNNTWGFGIPNTTTGLPTNNYRNSFSK